MTSLKKLTALLGAGALVFAMAGTVSAVTVWATPDDWFASSAGDQSNSEAFWEDRFDLDEGDCHKLTSDELDAVMNEDGSASLGAAYDFVVVKQANPNAKDVDFDNTIFEDVAADETVFADTDGDGSYTEDDSNGISHIIVCGPSETTTTTTTTTTVTTTTDTFTIDTGGETDAASEPNTATIGGPAGAPADGAWVLVIALGVLLASIVVLTPAKARR